MRISFTKGLSTFFSKPIFRDERFIFGLWILSALAMGILKSLHSGCNNYMIFKYVFWHAVEQTNLYSAYPDLYFDANHYGPVFSLVIAPFALLPDKIGIPLWTVLISMSLYYAVRSLPVAWKYKAVILYICIQEMLCSAASQQTNSLVAALIIAAFVSIHRGKDFYAGLFIAFGVFIKLYGIVGLAFFFFSRNKPKLIISCIFWSAVMFALPMAISSPEFIIQSYQDWFHSLVGKNIENIASMSQDVSVMGMFRRIFGHRELSNMLFLIPALILFALQYLQVGMYHDLRYRLGLLASALLFVVLFSSGSESSTYIIAAVGAGIWFISQSRPYSGYTIFLLVFVLLAICSSSDIFPASVYRNYVYPYSLKAIPFFAVWLTLIFQMLNRKWFEKSLNCL